MNIGNLLLWVSLAISLASLLIPMLPANEPAKKTNLMASRQLFYLNGVIISFAFLFLFFAFLTDDFRFFYVYNNSSASLPVVYKIAAIWAGKEGSFLLWLLFLPIMGIMIAKTEKFSSDIILGVISVMQIFILIMLIVESPFQFIWYKLPELFQGRTFLPAGLDGKGMNPLLLDPWMVTHPPVLFLGYASALVPFAYAIEAMIKNEYKNFIERSYRWVLFSLTTLGIGIFLGGFWAYKVLGWGGFWGWDPVENSSLIPWLAALALLHTMIVQKRKKALLRSNLVLSMVYFVLVLYSTFLTRSGVLSDFSVHSFSGGGVAWFIIFLILFSLTAGFFLFFKRFQSIKGEPLGESFRSWDNFTVYGATSLAAFGAVILVGTSMPILSGFFAENAASAASGFYNNLSIMFALIFLAFMVLSTVFMQNYKKTTATIIGAASIALSIVLNYYFSAPLPAYILAAAAFFAVIQYSLDLILLKRKPIINSRVAHIGAALLILGCAASGYYNKSYQKTLSMGEEESLGLIMITFDKFDELAGGDEGEACCLEHDGSSLAFTMLIGARTQKFACPYYISGQTNSLYREPYILRRLSGDIYITADDYTSGREKASVVFLSSGEKTTLGDCEIVFLNFKTEGMMSETPATYAELTVNGRKVSPGIKLEKGQRRPTETYIPGTKREILLLGFNPDEKTARIYVEPSSTAEIPADTVLVDLSVKPLIWLVWLGTILIAAGGMCAMVRKQKS